MNQEISYKFLLLCKDSFMQGMSPLSSYKSNTKEYLALVEIAKKYFIHNKYEEFSYFFQEGQFFIQLWAAHLILDFGNPYPDLTRRCLTIIKRYSNNPLAVNAALEETEWLNKNKEGKKKISIESLIKSINQEIDWCEENKDMVSEEYAKGFIKGLEQVIHILKQIEEVGE